MKTISVAVSPEDYETFRAAARRQHRPIAQLIREAMAFYREAVLEDRKPLLDLPVLVGNRPIAALPDRAEYFEELFDRTDQP